MSSRYEEGGLYAYFVIVQGKKRLGGVITAGSMEDAAQKAKHLCGLSVNYPPVSLCGLPWKFCKEIRLTHNRR